MAYLKPFHCIIWVFVFGSLIFLARSTNAAKRQTQDLIQNATHSIQSREQQQLSSSSSRNHEHIVFNGNKPSAGKVFGLEQGAPDLQFGLALTIPFVSLATEKLITSLTGGGFGSSSSLGGGGYKNNHHRGLRSWSDLMSILKLNVGGLVLAAVVGIGALFFLPTLFHNKGILKGFGSNLFENLISNGIGGNLNKHFGYGQYETYDHHQYGQNNYGNAGGFGIGGFDSGNKNFAGNPFGWQRDSRARSLNSTNPNDNNINDNSIWTTLQSGIIENWSEISGCGLYAMCIRGREFNSNSSSSSGDDHDNFMSQFSSMNPYLKQLEEAYLYGQNQTISTANGNIDTTAGPDCASKYQQCSRVPKLIDSIGNYLFL